MATRLELWRGALTALTGGGIDALDDPDAEPIANIFDAERGACLSLRQWPWTLKRARMARQAAPDWPEEYGYPLPADALVGAPVALYDAVESHSPTVLRWRNRGGVVYTNAEALWIEYQFDAPEETWPLVFFRWVRYRIMTELAGTPYGRADLKAGYRTEARRIFMEELTPIIAQTEPPKVLFGEIPSTAMRGSGYGAERLVDYSTVYDQ